MSENKTYEGVVKFFDTKNGFGFITMTGTTTDFFAHVSGLIDTNITTGDKVFFELVEGKRGQKAINVTKI